MLDAERLENLKVGVFVLWFTLGQTTEGRPLLKRFVGCQETKKDGVFVLQFTPGQTTKLRPLLKC